MNWIGTNCEEFVFVGFVLININCHSDSKILKEINFFFNVK